MVVVVLLLLVALVVVVVGVVAAVVVLVFRAQQIINSNHSLIFFGCPSNLVFWCFQFFGKGNEAKLTKTKSINLLPEQHFSKPRRPKPTPSGAIFSELKTEKSFGAPVQPHLADIFFLHANVFWCVRESNHLNFSAWQSTTNICCDAGRTDRKAHKGLGSLRSWESRVNLFDVTNPGQTLCLWSEHFYNFLPFPCGM